MEIVILSLLVFQFLLVYYLAKAAKNKYHFLKIQYQMNTLYVLEILDIQ